MFTTAAGHFTEICLHLLRRVELEFRFALRVLAGLTCQPV